MTATEELRTELLTLLSEAAPPNGRFTTAELNYLLAQSGDIYEAASQGWHMKADKLIEAGGLVQTITIGAESWRFSSIPDLIAYCDKKANYYEKKSTTASNSGALIIHLEPTTVGVDELGLLDELEDLEEI